MTAGIRITPGQVYESCDPRGGFAIRIVTYTPGANRADVVDHQTGKYPRSILVTSLHVDATTHYGTPRRTGYRLVQDAS